MTDLRGGKKHFTHAELTEIVHGFAAAGSPFDYIAGFIEADNRPHCIDREPEPGDGPDYHADHSYWASRQSEVTE
jgi:hypothetical protein